MFRVVYFDGALLTDNEVWRKLVGNRHYDLLESMKVVGVVHVLVRPGNVDASAKGFQRVVQE